MRLLLLRHAKSDWTNADNLGDHNRKLAPRGRNAAKVMARYLREHGYAPDVVLCSTAMRTRETLNLIRPSFRRAPRIHFLRSLYLAEWPVLLAAIRKMPAKAGTVLLIGHNPGMEELALALARSPKTESEQKRLRLLRKRFPTAALATLDFDSARWVEIKPKQGRLYDFKRVKDLPKDESDSA